MISDVFDAYGAGLSTVFSSGVASAGAETHFYSLGSKNVLSQV